jgi:CO/xanthine dehydrogenase FAD-binding subunit
MLINLKTVHKPASLADAVTLLAAPGVYPLYGGVALQRRSSPAVEAAVSLDQLGLNMAQDGDNALVLGTMLTLEAARHTCLARADARPEARALAALLAAEQPETLRNTMTLGDLLVERDPQSLVLTLLLALGAVIERADVQVLLTMSSFLGMEEDVARYLLTGLRVPYGAPGAAIAWEKVARTPADAPIVGAVARVQVGENGGRFSALALCGVAPVPVGQPEVVRAYDESGDVDAALAYLELDPPDDHWGSREYRAEMARVTARRALLRAANDAR